MAYRYISTGAAKKFCKDVFVKMGFSETDSAIITDVLITADLFGHPGK